MNDCIFCKIVKGEIPSYTLYEDDNFMAFLDIYPRVKGHTLVIPKKHYRFVYDVPDFGTYWLKALHITKALQKALKPQFISYITHGLEIPHAHIHILPRGEHDHAFVPEQKKFSEKEMKSIQKKVAKYCKK